MINKFFKHGTGGSAGVIDYLLGKERDRADAQVIRGEETITSQLIDSSLFKRKYTSGCLSFEESDISEDKKQALMDGFEREVRAGMDVQDVNFLWIEHRDKGRLELNFVIPNLHLSTGKSFTPYVHKIDLKRFDTWKDIQNFKHGFSDPKEPIKQQLLTTKSNQKPDRKKATLDINQAVLNGIKQGSIRGRADIVTLLETQGLQVEQRKKYLSLVMPGEQQNLRLKGALYEKSFTVGGLNNTRVEEIQQEHRRATERNYTELQQKHSELQQSASRRNQARYRGNTSERESLRRETSPQNVSVGRLDERVNPMVSPVNISSARDIIHHARDMVSKQRNIHHHDKRNAPVLRKLEELRQSHDRNRENAPEEFRGTAKRLSSSILRAKQTNELNSRLGKLSSKRTSIVKRRRSLDTQRIRAGNKEEVRNMRHM
jgi:hypothetical protein